MIGQFLDQLIGQGDGVPFASAVDPVDGQPFRGPVPKRYTSIGRPSTEYPMIIGPEAYGSGVTVGVMVTVGVFDGVKVRVTVRVCDGVRVKVRVNVDVRVAVDVAVAVAVGGGNSTVATVFPNPLQ